jgi:formylglycine-generating enzyme required for sulfatase activity
LGKELKLEGFSVWLDQLDIPLGARWDDEVYRALVECEIFMLIMTPAAVASENVKDEIGYAIDNHKHIMPILLERCEVPFRLRRVQYVDFTNKSFDEGVQSVKELLRNLLAQMSILRETLPASPDQIAHTEAERKAEEDAKRLAKQKAEAELAVQTKAETERNAKAEADRLAAQKLEEERIARAKTEAARLAALKAEEEQAAKAKADAERKAEEERAAKAKAEADRRAKKEEVDRLAAQKAKEERAAKAKVDEKAIPVEVKKDLVLSITTEKKPVSKAWVYVTGVVVILLIVGIGFSVLWKGGNKEALTSTPTNMPVVEAPAIKTKATATAPIPWTLGIGSTMISEKDGMTLLYVPAGEFEMGIDSGPLSDNHPAHKVSLNVFWIDKTEVTNGMYAKCVDAGVCNYPAYALSNSHINYYGNPKFSAYPVIHVSWIAANVYCTWADRRLPTEAEWEKAARGTDGRSYPWGNDAPNNGLLNYNGAIGDTTKVGEYPDGDSPYGALDMAGNVSEWVNDWYEPGYYGKSPYFNPQGLAIGKYKVLRGGSYKSSASSDDVLVFSRDMNLLADESGTTGFRCARSK